MKRGLRISWAGALALLGAGLWAAWPTPGAAQLVGFWQYENAGNLGLDSSAAANHLNAVAAPTQGAGQFGSGLNLNGTSQMLDRAIFPTGVPTGGSSYTVSTWFNADSGGARGLVGWGNYGAGNQVNAFRLGGTTELHSYWWGNDLVRTGLPDMTTGSPPAGWHQAVATYNATTLEHRIYLDGVQVAGRVGTGLNSAATNFAVGRTFPGGSEFFHGQLDDTAIFSSALSPNQIVGLGNGSARPNNLPASSPLVGLWRFNTAAIGTDSSALGNNLTVNGNAVFNAAGKFGGAMQLDGNGDFLSTATGQVPTGVPFGNSDYTISAWIRPDAATNPLGSQNGIVGWGDYGQVNEVTAIRTAADVFAGGQGFRHYWWANDQDASAGATNLYDGNFHNVMVTYDDAGNARNIYLDGVLIGTGAPGNHLADVMNFAIGRTFPGANEFFDGLLDDVAIFNDDLNAAQRAAVLAGDFSQFLPQAVPEPGSIALWSVAGIALGLSLRYRRRERSTRIG